MLGDELPNEHEIFVGDYAVAVAQWFLHAPQCSGDRFGTQAENKNYRILTPNYPQLLTNSSTFAGGTRMADQLAKEGMRKTMMMRKSMNG